MSFYSSHRHPRPGRIEGNPLQGLNHRVAVNVTRILDACMAKYTLENSPLDITDRSLPPPVRFINATSAQNNAAITNLSVSRLRERPTFARVSCDVTVPLRVTYECAQGNRWEGPSQVTCRQDVVLFAPGESIFPFEVMATASASAPSGFARNGEITATVCCTVITKVVTDTDLLIPSYGLAIAPPCTNFREDACKEFFDLPLYPMGNPTSHRPRGPNER